MAVSSRLNRLLEEVKALISAQRQTKKTTSTTKPSDKKEENSSCPHHFGYLGSRSKKSRIPQGCLACQKVVECMARKSAR